MCCVERIEYRGVTYRRYPNAKSPAIRRYFYGKRDGKNEALHRAVYADYYGDIPEGLVVHHKDGDTANNSPENLVALTRSQHGEEHCDPNAGTLTLYKREWARAKQKKSPREHKLPTKYNCAVCGVEFESFQTDRAKFCSTKCHDIHHSVGPTKCVCQICGSEFLGTATTIVCSKECRIEHAKIREAIRHKATYVKRVPKELEKLCAWCGAPFTTHSTAIVLCSDACRTEKKRDNTRKFNKQRSKTRARV